MSSTNKTTHYDLSQYVSSDKPTYLSDYNGDMLKIDTGINTAKTTADGAATAAGNAQTAAEGAQNIANTAVTNAATADGKANTALTNIGTLANLDTAVKTSTVAAINEVVGDIGNKANLTTTAKTDLVSAINEINGEIEVTTQLYLNASGTNTGFTISDNFDNYDRIEIFYTDNDLSGEMSTEFDTARSSKVYLNMFNFASNNYMYFRSKVLTFSGTSVTVSSSGEAAVGNTSYSTQTDSIKVLEVIGYKKK